METVTIITHPNPFLHQISAVYNFRQCFNFEKKEKLIKNTGAIVVRAHPMIFVKF